MALALLPGGADANRVRNDWFANCVRPHTVSSSMWSQWLAGDSPIRLADDLPHLAATLELLLIHGTPGAITYAEVAKHVMEKRTPILASGLIGTFVDFAEAIELLAGTDTHYSFVRNTQDTRRILAGVVRAEILDTLDGATEPASEIAVLHGKSRDWVGSITAGEKIVRQHRLANVNRIANDDFVQFVVPPPDADQWVLGIQLCLDDCLVSKGWDDVGSWFEMRRQPAGKALMMFDEPANDADAARADGAGTFSVRLLGLSAEHMPTEPSHGALLPPSLIKLVKGHPEHWPAGYAEAMALPTFASRANKLKTGVRNRNAREIKWAEKAGDRAPSLNDEPLKPKLYSCLYHVV